MAEKRWGANQWNAITTSPVVVTSFKGEEELGGLADFVINYI